MVKRISLPSNALEEICALVNLSSDQLKSLSELFSQADAANPLQPDFVERVAESLGINLDEARDIVAVCHFLLIHAEARDDEVFVEEILDDFKLFLQDNLRDEVREPTLGKFSENREDLKMLALPKPGPLLQKKIERLASEPEDQLESIRTICQLRPLFDGSEHNEEIKGLVPTVLVELKLENSEGESSVVLFGMNDEKLKEIEKVIARTREKVELISEKYQTEILPNQSK